MKNDNRDAKTGESSERGSQEYLSRIHKVLNRLAEVKDLPKEFREGIRSELQDNKAFLLEVEE